MASLKVSEGFQKLAEQVADERGVSVPEACDIIGETAVGRWNALRKYANKMKAIKEAKASEKPPKGNP